MSRKNKPIILDPRDKDFDFDEVNMAYFKGCALELREVEYLHSLHERGKDKIDYISPVWSISDIYSGKDPYISRPTGVYCFLDPRKYSKDGVFEFHDFKSIYAAKYIGKGGLGRIVNHSTPSKSKVKAESRLQQWIVKMRSIEKIEPIVLFFIIGCNADFAYDLESDLIRSYRLQEDDCIGNEYYRVLQASTLLNMRDEKGSQIFNFNGYKIKPKNGANVK